MTKLHTLLVLSYALFLTACGATGSNGIQADDDVAEQHAEFWAIELHVTGGKAGLGRSIYVSNDGKIIVKDVRKKLYVEHLMTKKQLQALDILVPARHFNDEEMLTSRGVQRCRACTNYNLAFQRGTRRGHIHTTGRQLAHSEYKKLIHKLVNLQNRIIRRYSRR